MTSPEAVLQHGVRWDAAWVSHRGHRRADNQDRAAAGAGFIVIADGVGGSPDGGAAAEAAVERFSELAGGISGLADVSGVVRAVHQHVLDAAAAGCMPPDSSTTLVAAVLAGQDVIVAVVGDSPAWVLETETARSLARLQHRWDPLRQSFVLLSAIGLDPLMDPGVVGMPVGAGLRLVLASDGVFTDPADSDAPQSIELARDGTPQQAAQRVLDATLAGDALDNITVAVVDVIPGTVPDEADRA